MTVSISAAPFGTLPDGRAVTLYTLTHESGLRAKIMDYGAITTSIITPDRSGAMGEVTLGYNALSPYLTDQHFLGATIGRYANRIGGARFSLAAKRYALPANDGENHLHGADGFHAQMWDGQIDGQSLRLTLRDPDGHNGYPGTVDAVLTVTVTRDSVVYRYRAATDAPTPINMTNHNYFNLAGEGDILDHSVQINSAFITPVDAGGIPTGQIMAVKDTPFDRRDLMPVQAMRGGLYDHNYGVDGWDGALRLAAALSEPKSGRRMDMLTTQPGLQFYTGAHMPRSYPGRGGTYGPHSGLCLEGQHYPDSPNQPHFPSTIIAPGQRYDQTIAYRFSVTD